MRLLGKALEQVREEVHGRMEPGEEIVMIGPAGLSGTASLAVKKELLLRKRLSAAFLRDAARLPEENSLKDAFGTMEELAAGYGITSWLPLGEGGFLAGLWKLTEASRSGCMIDLRSVPICQHTVEICEVLHMDPYQLEAEGAFLAALPQGGKLCADLKEKGLRAAVIGRCEKGNDRLMRSNTICRCLSRPLKTGDPD